VFPQIRWPSIDVQIFYIGNCFRAVIIDQRGIFRFFFLALNGAIWSRIERQCLSYNCSSASQPSGSKWVKDVELRALQNLTAESALKVQEYILVHIKERH